MKTNVACPVGAIRPVNGGPTHTAPDAGADLTAEAIDQLIAQGKAAALAANTLKTYKTGWRSWARWAVAHHLPAFPAASNHLQAWLATLSSQGKKPTTLNTYLAAVVHKHRSRPEPNPAQHPQVRLLLSGLARQAADQGITPEQAAPLRWKHVQRIVETAYRPRHNQPGGRLETPRQAQERAEADIAMIALAHDAALRCCELLALTWADIELSEDRASGLVRIRRSKTDQYGKGAVAPISEFTAQALSRIRPADADPGDRIFNLSPNTVTRRIKAAAEAADINFANISSHSPRVGMAQDLAAHGIHMPGLMLAGRWKTPETAARYIQDLIAHHTPAGQYLKSQRHPTQPPPTGELTLNIPGGLEALPKPA